MSAALSVLVLTEDGSSHAFDVLQVLAKKMLALVVPNVATHRVRLEPSAATRDAMRANRWKSKKPQDRIRLVHLRQALATKVLEDGPPGYVLFHFDGDRPWSERASSENVREFSRFVKSVRPILETKLTSPTDIDERLQRICPVVPFYSVESWLYQNTERARELCLRGCGKHLALFDAWERDAGALDELTKPKKSACLDGNNLLLAETFTTAIAERLYEAAKSFHCSVERLQQCPGIREALRATQDWDPPPTAP